MVKRSNVSKLSASDKAWLDKTLVELNFSRYEALAQHLRDKGYEDISKSGLQRYGSNFERSLANITLATEQARAVAESAPDDENALSEGLIRLIQTKCFEVLRDTEFDPDKVSLAQLGKIAAELGDTSVSVKKYRATVRAAAKAAAAEVGDIAKSAGLSAETIKKINAKILGVVT